MVAGCAWAAPTRANPQTPAAATFAFFSRYRRHAFWMAPAPRLGRLAAEAPLTPHLLPPLGGAEAHLVRQQLAIPLRTRRRGGRRTRGMLLRLALLVIAGAGLGDD